MAADIDGALAKRFSIQTSGHALLYDSDGKLLFSGGITGGRGHAGDNEGRQTLTSFLEDGTSPSATRPVYGCPLCQEGNP